MIVIEEELGCQGDQEKTKEVSFQSSEEALDVSVPFLVAFIAKDLFGKEKDHVPW